MIFINFASYKLLTYNLYKKFVMDIIKKIIFKNNKTCLLILNGGENN